MVALFEQWETEQQQKSRKKNLSKSYTLILILMSEISILSSINQQDCWLPGVFYTGNELILGAAL